MPSTETRTAVITPTTTADVTSDSSLRPEVFTGAFASDVWAGRYRIVRLLGNGTQGSTFLAQDLKTDARVAIKVFDFGRATDWKAVELFEREVQTLKDVSHPRMPQFIDVIGEPGEPARALVMTHVAGTSWAECTAEGPHNEAALWRILADTADILRVLHEHSPAIVHRDIKPEHLIQQSDGTTALVDFGGVGAARPAAGSTVVGTFGYMAPEQLYGAQTPATDLYALGASVLFVATGQQPEALPRQGLAIDVDKAAPQLSPALRGILRQLTAPDPKQRYADARALQAALNAPSSDATSSQTRKPLEPAVDWSTGENDRAIAFGVLSVLLGVVGSVLALAIGQVLIPVILTVLAELARGPQRERLLQARGNVVAASKHLRGGFRRTLLEGSAEVERASALDKQQRKAAKKARKQARKTNRNTISL